MTGLQRAWQLAGSSLTIDQAFTVLHHGIPAPGGPLPYTASNDPRSRVLIASVYDNASAMSINDFLRSAEGARIAKSCTIYVRKVTDVV